MRGGPITEKRVAAATQQGTRTGIGREVITKALAQRVLYVTLPKPAPEQPIVSTRLGRRVEVKTTSGATTSLTSKCSVKFEGITDVGSKFTITDGRRRFTLEINAAGYKTSTRIRGKKTGIATVAATKRGYAFETTDGHTVRIVAVTNVVAFVREQPKKQTAQPTMQA
ncbi:hypothetical protein HY992_02855 [Candidatus Micrarchaeota archaeon]|nr:hypothetical protein [Candidatus Micrarchaeota archaeon]